jgi:hypothetical protein
LTGEEEQPAALGERRRRKMKKLGFWSGLCAFIWWELFLGLVHAFYWA